MERINTTATASSSSSMNRSSAAAKKRKPAAKDDGVEILGTSYDSDETRPLTRAQWQRREAEAQKKVKVEPRNHAAGEIVCPVCFIKKYAERGCKLMTCANTSLHPNNEFVYYCGHCGLQSKHSDVLTCKCSYSFRRSARLEEERKTVELHEEEDEDTATQSQGRLVSESSEADSGRDSNDGTNDMAATVEADNRNEDVAHEGLVSSGSEVASSVSYQSASRHPSKGASRDVALKGDSSALSGATAKLMNRHKEVREQIDLLQDIHLTFLQSKMIVPFEEDLNPIDAAFLSIDKARGKRFVANIDAAASSIATGGSGRTEETIKASYEEIFERLEGLKPMQNLELRMLLKKGRSDDNAIAYNELKSIETAVQGRLERYEKCFSGLEEEGKGKAISTSAALDVETESDETAPSHEVQSSPSYVEIKSILPLSSFSPTSSNEGRTDQAKEGDSLTQDGDGDDAKEKGDLNDANAYHGASPHVNPNHGERDDEESLPNDGEKEDEDSVEYYKKRLVLLRNDQKLKVEKTCRKRRKKGQPIDLTNVPRRPPIINNRKNATSKYKGVSFNKASNKWIAKIQVDGKSRRIGSYDNEEDAAVDYARAVFWTPIERASAFIQDNIPDDIDVPSIISLLGECLLYECLFIWQRQETERYRKLTPREPVILFGDMLPILRFIHNVVVKLLLELPQMRSLKHYNEVVESGDASNLALMRAKAVVHHLLTRQQFKSIAEVAAYFENNIKTTYIPKKEMATPFITTFGYCLHLEE